MTKAEVLNTLFKKYGLTYDASNPESKENDVYIHKHYRIITRTGIQKIELASGIFCNITPVEAACGKDHFTVVGSAEYEGKKYTTFASASEWTSTNKYYPEMAEKRCRSRLILTLVGLYEQGFFSEDEADKFSQLVKERNSGVVVKPISRGQNA